MSEYNKSGAAMMLAKLGYSVVPLHHAVGSGCSCSKRQKCGSPGKHPRERGWKGKAAGADQLRQIDESWGKYPHANIGVCTGSRYGLIVLDFDFRHGASAVALDWCNQHPDWWQGAMIVVNDEQRGFHAYFRCQHEPITKGDIFPGVDVRGNGGCVVGVGSIHASGNTYEPWGVRPVMAGAEYTTLGFRERKTITPLDQLPMLPDFLVEATQERHKERLRKYSGTTQEKLNAKEKAAGVSELEQHRKAVDDAIAETIPTRAGRRHTGVFQLARRLRHIFGEHAQTEMLRKIVRGWQRVAEETAQASGFELRGRFIDTWEEFLKAWERIHTPSDGTDGNAAMIATMNRQLSTGPKPEAVAACLEELGYDDDDDALLSGLVLLLWQLQQRNPEQSFPCSARFAADCVNAAAGLEIGFQQYSKRLTLLCRDGVIVRTAQGTQSPKSAKSAEYRWAWGDDNSAVVSAWTSADRIRAASKAGPPKAPAVGPSPLRGKDRSKYRQPHARPEWKFVVGVLLRYRDGFSNRDRAKWRLAWEQLGHYGPVVRECFQTRAFFASDAYERNAMAAGFIAVLDAMTDQQ